MLGYIIAERHLIESFITDLTRPYGLLQYMAGLILMVRVALYITVLVAGNVQCIGGGGVGL